MGLSYVVTGELWLESTPIHEARHLREVIVHAGRHRSYWHNLRRIIHSPEGVPQTCYPRSRVVFVKATGR